MFANAGGLPPDGGGALRLPLLTVVFQQTASGRRFAAPQALMYPEGAMRAAPANTMPINAVFPRPNYGRRIAFAAHGGHLPNG